MEWTYDGLGRRSYALRSDGTYSYYHHSGDQLVAEATNNSNNVFNWYTFTDKVDDLVHITKQIRVGSPFDHSDPSPDGYAVHTDH